MAGNGSRAEWVFVVFYNTYIPSYSYLKNYGIKSI